MSNKHVSFSSATNKIIPIVSGDGKMDNDSEYVRQQEKIIRDKYSEMYNGSISGERQISNPIFNRHSLIETSFKDAASAEYGVKDTKSSEYDPVTEYLHSKGLVSTDSKVRYNVNYINIDSSNRKITPSVKVSLLKELTLNPLSIEENLLWIFIPEHNFVINDRITLSNVTYKYKELKTVTKNSDDENLYAVEFTEGSQYAKIKTSPNISITLLGSISTTYDTSDMLIDISGLKGYPTEAYIGNIPLNQLNKTHKVYLGIPGSVTSGEIPNESYFFIKLPKKFKGLTSTLGYNISITFRYYGGVPINEINADYPVNNFHIKGYHLVSKITTDSIAIKLPRKGYYTGDFGGNNVYLGLVDEIDAGYPNPSNYKISLEKTFSNVTLVRMVSSEFPNTDKVFKNYPEASRNNRIYFQNIDDGDHVYYIEIDPGNYDPSALKTILESKFYNTPKITVQSGTAYSANNYIQVDINRNSDVVTFKSFKEALLTKPITKITPNIDVKDTTAGAASYVVTMQHTSHGLSVGSKIVITGAIEHLGIPQDILNTEHTISTVIDDDKYEFVIKHFNLQTVKNQTNGGFSVKVYVPNIFRLRFDYPDTMGKQLGFRNPGNETSITQYLTEISNKDLYQDEIDTDELGNTKNITNNSLLLSGDNYILMTCRELSGIINTGKISNVFAKINLTGVPGRMLYDSFVSSPIFFYDPLAQLSELSFSFYSTSGEFFDFNGIDHSFTLEIVTIDNQPSQTGLTTNMATNR
jgi:hypothetical protein